MSTLSTRAMLASLRISQWTGQRHDRAVSVEVTQSKGAESDAGRFNKHLVDKGAMKKIDLVVSKSRGIHLDRTLPWSNDGSRILPGAGFIDYKQEMERLKAEFNEAADAFTAAYPHIINESRARMGSMFNLADYPAPELIRKKFDFGYIINPVPDAADFRIDIGEAQAEIVRQEIEERAAEGLKIATRDVYKRIAEVAGRMVEALPKYVPGDGITAAKGVFRSTLVTNITELADILPALNVAGDPALNDLAQRLRDELTQHDAQDLKNNKRLREGTAAAAKAILDDVSQFLA